MLQFDCVQATEPCRFDGGVNCRWTKSGEPSNINIKTKQKPGAWPLLGINPANKQFFPVAHVTPQKNAIFISENIPRKVGLPIPTWENKKIYTQTGTFPPVSIPFCWFLYHPSDFVCILCFLLLYWMCSSFQTLVSSQCFYVVLRSGNRTK